MRRTGFNYLSSRCRWGPLARELLLLLAGRLEGPDPPGGCSLSHCDSLFVSCLRWPTSAWSRCEGRPQGDGPRTQTETLMVREHFFLASRAKTRASSRR